MNNLFMIKDSLFLCLEKILNLLFREQSSSSQKLYDEILDRLGEGVLSISHRMMGNRQSHMAELSAYSIC